MCFKVTDRVLPSLVYIVVTLHYQFKQIIYNICVSISKIYIYICMSILNIVITKSTRRKKQQRKTVMYIAAHCDGDFISSTDNQIQ
jgi:hypothetical protein